MKVFAHHIYEYKKGIRNLILHTMNAKYRIQAEQMLKRNDISYIIQEVSSQKINIFFGEKECIEVLRNFGTKMLNNFTDEEDFILGIMLGYDRVKQCARYLKRKYEKLSFKDGKMSVSQVVC